MKAPIEIKINSQVLEKIIIQSLEQSIPVNKNQKNDSEYLKCVGSKDTMEILGIGKRAFENLVCSHILEPMQMGSGFKIPLWQLEEFQKAYKGMDLSTYEKCVIAKEKVDAATSTKD